MELNQLRYFVKLSQVQNFSRAAEELFVTQPTLSQQIKRLENELGVELFTRSTRSVRLTEHGQLCYEHAKAALDELDKLSTTAGEIQRQKAGHLAIGILAVLPHWDISAALSDFCREYPQLEVKLEFDWSMALIEQLLNKKLDVIISKVFWKDNDPDFDSLNIYPIDNGDLRVIVGKSHPLARQNMVRIEQLAGEQVLMADHHACVVQALNNIVKENGMQPLRYHEVRSNNSLFRMIEGNMGISVMSDDILQEYDRYDDVRFLPLSPKSGLKTAVVTRKGLRADAPVRLFKNFIMDFVEKSRLKDP